VPAIAPDSHPLALACAAADGDFARAMEQLDFRSAAETLLQLAITANGYLNERAPWSRFKQEGASLAVAEDLYSVLDTCRWLAVLLTPLLPDLASRMHEQLGLSPLASHAPADTAVWLNQRRWGQLNAGAALPEPSPVMQRLELDSPL
jgi:methionyl-tRNA synthetase